MLKAVSSILLVLHQNIAQEVTGWSRNSRPQLVCHDKKIAQQHGRLLEACQKASKLFFLYFHALFLFNLCICLYGVVKKKYTEYVYLGFLYFHVVSVDQYIIIVLVW